MFCWGSFNLVHDGWLIFGLLNSLGLGIEISISTSENFLIIFKKWSGFPEESTKEAFSTDLISK